MACASVTIPDQPSTQGFTLAADKVSGDTEYTANITITKSDDLNGTVRLMKRNLIIWECIPGLDNIQLVNGKATVQLLVNKSGSILAAGGLGCTCSTYEICQKSNMLELKVGSDTDRLVQYALYGALILGGAYAIGQIFGRRS